MPSFAAVALARNSDTVALRRSLSAPFPNLKNTPNNVKTLPLKQGCGR